jgi:hypothetical protein
MSDTASRRVWERESWRLPLSGWLFAWPGRSRALDDGRRVFIKAVSEEANLDSPGIHRQEARIVAALPLSVPVPRLLSTYDEAGWRVPASSNIAPTSNTGPIDVFTATLTP